jgi:anthranilate synthase component II
MAERSPSILFLDNFDSFSYSLADEFLRVGSRVEVWRNDASLEKLTARLESHDLLVVSPGPGRPEDAGVLLPLLVQAAGRCPVFGVCLGHQALAAAFGGSVGRAPRLKHGKSGEVRHHSQGIFAGLTEPFVAGRYHSLAVTRIPSGFRMIAWVDENGRQIPMAMEDTRRRLLGVQFHPESVLTRDGSRLIERVLTWATT